LLAELSRWHGEGGGLDLCQSLLDNNTLLFNVAARSYLHPNGFYKIDLLGRPQTLTSARLHIWPSGGIAESDVHDHQWDFASLTIAGSAEVTYYTPRHGGERIEYRVDSVPLPQTHPLNRRQLHWSRFAEVGVVDLLPMASMLLSCGTVYWLQSDVLHSVRRADTGRVLATVVLRGPGIKNASTVIRRERYTSIDQQVSGGLAADGLCLLVRELRELLSSS
jgi:hypothetical protein